MGMRGKKNKSGKTGENEPLKAARNIEREDKGSEVPFF